MHLSEAELARLLTRGQVRLLVDAAPEPPPITEGVWQRAVMRRLRQQGYSLIYHTFDSRRSPSGFPDIIAVHETPGRALLAIELKTDAGQVTQAQQAWLNALAGCTGVVAEVWRPAMFQELVEKLRG